MTIYKLDPFGRETTTIKLDRFCFLPKPPQSRKYKKTYLLIGFDTEYQHQLNEDGRELGNEVLSYQFCCETISLDEKVPKHRWSGIVLPHGPNVGDRLSLTEFIRLSISEGIRTIPGLLVPRDIYLICHFTRSDIPGLSEFKDGSLRKELGLENVRNTFVTLGKSIVRDMSQDPNDPIPVNITVRDTLHLSPQGFQSLESIGDLLGFEKIKLGKTIEENLTVKKNMKSLLTTNWELFREYSIRDSEICVEYSKHLITIYHQLSKKYSLPVTLTSIGVDILQNHWGELGVDPHRIVGKELVRKRVWNKLRGHYQMKKELVDLQRLFWSLDFLTECYHGGRNEQFVFGPGHEDVWFDYDLQSAYPSTMSLIGIPDWDGIRQIKDLDELLSYKPVDLVFCNVEFEFPDSVRYPCLPVRTDNGLIFPRKGVSSTHISEVKLSEKLGCKLKFIEGRYIPSVRHKDPNGINRVFREFLKTCTEKRNEHPKKTMMNLFWKEISNSTYGKLGQGLRRRRVFDLKDETVVDLQPSVITNPVYSGFITSFCRGVLSEIMNNLPSDRVVFSVTTDGFLTNTTEEELKKSTHGVLCRYYKDSRKQLVGDETIYEVKHVVRQPLGWRTRGQSTIKPGLTDDLPSPKEEDLIVLAKGGIKLPEKLSKREENYRMVDLFFERTPNSQLPEITGIGIKDMYLKGEDFIDVSYMKRVSMEFDWKRKPINPRMMTVSTPSGKTFTHLRFDTVPWDSMDQFFTTRNMWDDYQRSDLRCLKTVEDLQRFGDYHGTSTNLEHRTKKYLKKVDGDLIRLRREIITSWRYRKGGTHVLKPHSFGYTQIFPTYKMTSQLFSEILNDHVGIPCKKSDVDNGIKIKTFIPYQVPSTERTRTLLMVLRDNLFPELDIDQFLSKSESWDLLK